MKILKFLVLYIWSRFAQLESANVNDDVSKIYGGQNVTALAYPYALAMFYMQEQQFFCGASALNYYYIVSAAHCLVRRVNTTSPWYHVIRHERLMVIGGASYIRQILNDPRTDDLQENLAIQRRFIEETFIHTDYHQVRYPTLSINDIGVAKVHIPFTHLRNSVRPISVFSHVFWRAIHYQYQMYFANKTCYSVGWGNTILHLSRDSDQPHIPSRHLREIPMQVYQTEHCLAIYCKAFFGKRCTHSLLKNFIRRRINQVDQVLCAFTVRRQRGGPCSGDSGSPLTCSWIEPKKPEDHRGDVVGHHSDGLLCGTRHGGPSFYTEYIQYFGFFNIFDLKFIGALYNPWEPDNKRDDRNKRKRSARSQTSSSSRLTSGVMCLLLSSIRLLFRVFNVQ